MHGSCIHWNSNRGFTGSDSDCKDIKDQSPRGGRSRYALQKMWDWDKRNDMFKMWEKIPGIRSLIRTWIIFKAVSGTKYVDLKDQLWVHTVRLQWRVCSSRYRRSNQPDSTRKANPEADWLSKDSGGKQGMQAVLSWESSSLSSSSEMKNCNKLKFAIYDIGAWSLQPRER